MVGASFRSLSWRCLLLAVVWLSLLAAQPRHVRSQGLESEEKYAIEEEYLVELTSAGDARVIDVLSYSARDFAVYAEMFEKYPNLLSRRYRNDTYVGEIEDFEVEVNAVKATVTVTFFSPGYAYKMDDHWCVFGFPFQPAMISDREAVFRKEGTMNSEFTLFEEAAFSSTYRVKLPQGSSGAAYDAGKKALVYELPYMHSAGGNLLQRNRGIFHPLFGLLLILSMVLPLWLAGSSLQAPADSPAVVKPTAATPQRPGPIIPPSPPPAASTPRFCRNCGKTLEEADRSFCSGCGKPL